MNLLWSCFLLLFLAPVQEGKELSNEELTTIVRNQQEFIMNQQKVIDEMKIYMRQVNTSDLEDRVVALEVGLAIAEEDISDLEAGLTVIGGDVDDLQSSQEVQDERFLAIEADIEDLDNDSLDQDNRLDTIEGQVSNLEETINLLSEQVGVLESTDVVIQGDIDDLEGVDEALTSHIYALNITTNDIDERLNYLNTTVEVQMGNILALEEDLATAEADIDSLEGDIAEIESEFGDIETEFNDLEETVDFLHDTVASQQGAIDDLYMTDQQQNTGLIGINDNVEILQQDVSGLDLELDGLRTDVSDLDLELDVLGTDLNVSVGFLAVISSLACSDGILQFQNQRFNSGNGYDATTGIFTAQVAGLYHFTTYLRSHAYGGEDSGFYIRKNGAAQCRLWVEGEAAEAVHITSTCSAAMELLPGDEVYVSCVDVNELGGTDINGFTGFLTKPYV